MRRALVTGATGLVGSYIVDRLLADRWSVRALVRPPSASPSAPSAPSASSSSSASAAALEAAGVEPMAGDILDAESFAGAARGVDVIFHTAAAVTPTGGWEAYRRPNVDGTTNAIVAAERSGARLMHVSSVAVYGSTGRYRADGRKTDEEAPLGPLPDGAYYARSKRESERLVLDAHAAGRIWATAVRPDVIYGTRDRQFTPRVARALALGVVPLIGGGRSTLAVVHAANVADGSVRAATTDAAGGRAYNLANDYDVTVREFFELAAVGLRKRVRLVPVPTPVARAAFASAKLLVGVATAGRLSVLSNASLAILTEDNPFTSDRARRELGWAPPVRPDEGIPEAFAWIRTHR